MRHPGPRRTNRKTRRTHTTAMREAAAHRASTNESACPVDRRTSLRLLAQGWVYESEPRIAEVFRVALLGPVPRDRACKSFPAHARNLNK